MGIAQTGTGKTLAFGIPMIQRLAQDKGAKGLIILPTRELAVQVDEALNKIGRPIGLKTAILIGGENIGKQIRQLRNNPHIIIATPGRLIDHLEQKTVRLDGVCMLVLDEADRMLDMGFAPQIKKILVTVPHKRQTMLFSATMPQEIVQIANSYMQLPVRVEVAPAGTAAQLVTHELFFVHKQDKMALLQNLLNEYKGSILIFSRTKFGAKKIAAQLVRAGHKAAEIHSNRSLNQRLEALNGFKLGKYRVLVATDIAARGIDVLGIEVVINFDLPEQAGDYVHRIGRTGRAEHSGHAISFATPEQKFDVRAIERLIKKQLPVSPTPTLPKRTYDEAPEFDRFRAPRPHQPSAFSGPHLRQGSSGQARRQQGFGGQTRRPSPFQSQGRYGRNAGRPARSRSY
jgi:ATP-dependent RNA helicase RhlE